jgi:hypothetical protein
MALKLSDVNLLSFGNTVQMIGGIWAGDGKVYLCLFPEEGGDLDVHQPFVDQFEVKFCPSGQSSLHTDSLDAVHVLNMSPEEWQALLRQTDLMETEVLAKAKDGSLYKAVARKSQRQIDQGVSWRVFKRDGYACRYCASDDVPLTVDHLVLWEDGGPSTEANLVSACRKCNKTRGNTGYEEWLRHPHYLKVSARLTNAGREANLDLVPTLSKIQRVAVLKSR